MLLGEDLVLLVLGKLAKDEPSLCEPLACLEYSQRAGELEAPLDNRLLGLTTHCLAWPAYPEVYFRVRGSSSLLGTLVRDIGTSLALRWCPASSRGSRRKGRG